MTNAIPEKQNYEANLKLLRAQRSVYEHAKRLLALQIGLTVFLPVSSALLVIWFPGLTALTATIALCVVIVDAVVLDRIQRDARELGAKIQEVFDCAVLDLPWNGFTVGARPDPETVYEAAQSHGTDDDSTLRDWYPVVVGQVPVHIGRIICQRTNLFYDAKLRRYVGTWILAVVTLTSAILFTIGVALKLPLDGFVLTVFAPAVPAIVWGVKEFYRQRDAAAASIRLKNQAEDLWSHVVSGDCNELQCAEQARLFQNGIFERRSTAPTIFNWVYKKLRARLEPQMNAGAIEMVNQLQRTS